MPLPNGDPIKINVQGPDKNTVKAGEEFDYVVKVLDIDVKNSLDPTGVDPNVRIAFKITSMKSPTFQIAPNPDSDGNLVCFIRGRAHDEPGIYLDHFRGYNAIPGILTWDGPVDAFNAITVKSS